MSRGKINEANLTIVDGQLEGAVYRYVLMNEAALEYGQCYVGETAVEKVRIKSWRNKGNHTYGGEKCSRAREKYGWRCWNYEVLEKVYAPTLEQLKALLEEREAYWISFYDSVEHGFNTSDEGTGQSGVRYSEERRRKCGDSMRGKHHSAETIVHLRQVNKGKPRPQEVRDKISKANSGKKRTDEQRRAQSERMKGIVMSAKARAKSSATKTGKAHPISAEGRARINAAIPRRAVVGINVKDGERTHYKSLVEAGHAHNLKAGSISNYIKTGGCSKDGFRFEAA